MHSVLVIDVLFGAKMSKMYFRSFCVVFKKCQRCQQKETTSCVVYVSFQFVCSLLMTKIVSTKIIRVAKHSNLF
jgi:hypothetical protein